MRGLLYDGLCRKKGRCNRQGGFLGRRERARPVTAAKARSAVIGVVEETRASAAFRVMVVVTACDAALRLGQLEETLCRQDAAVGPVLWVSDATG